MSDASHDTRIKPGEVRNPKGRPKGSRNRLGEDFIAALADDFERNGIEAIAKVRTSKPSDYLKVIASLVPQQIELKRVADDISDERLDALIAALEEQQPKLRITSVTDVVEAEPQQSPPEPLSVSEVSEVQPLPESLPAPTPAPARGLLMPDACQGANAMATARARAKGDDAATAGALTDHDDASRPGPPPPMGTSPRDGAKGGPIPQSDPSKVAVPKQNTRKILGPSKTTAHAEALKHLRKPK